MRATVSPATTTTTMMSNGSHTFLAMAITSADPEMRRAFDPWTFVSNVLLIVT